MAIDLSKCVGCGACGIACKTENNTEHQNGGTTYNWADYLTFTTGKFPKVEYKVIPVLCNHCTNAPCVAICPVNAMYKTADGISMHKDDICIGCRKCQTACPYSDKDIISANKQYSVISFNPSTTPPHSFWADTNAVITNGTQTPAETVTAAGFKPPYGNDYTHTDYKAVRPSGVTEKCYFCDHRIKNGELPYCVVSCPSKARIFGDLSDPSSDISKAIANGYKRLAGNSGEWLSDNGTSPNVYYIGDFNEPNNITEPEVKIVKGVKIYPNPVSNIANIDFELDNADFTNISIFNVSGREVRKVEQNEFRLAGKNSLSFNVNGLSRGTYICTIKSGKQILSVNFIVQ